MRFRQSLRMNRRKWLMHQILGMVVLVPRVSSATRSHSSRVSRAAAQSRLTRLVAQSERLDPLPWEALARRAVDAARDAGARYAEARLTRSVWHTYTMSTGLYDTGAHIESDQELVGVGVRALVEGSWGFSASIAVTPDEIVRLAQDAVGQAKDSNKGSSLPVELGVYPIASGRWETPVRIDPFTVSIEEKEDFLAYWLQCIKDAGLALEGQGASSWASFVRQEQVVATSEGALFTQTRYESGGKIVAVSERSGLFGGTNNDVTQLVHGIDINGAGWERLLDARIPEQCRSGQLAQELDQQAVIPRKPITIGKYTLVCDGATMAALVEKTLGVATQLDRALGYEANAGGTSWIDDPLGMVGHNVVTSPLITLSANRSAPKQLATVKWDEEGVQPEPFTMIKDGVLVDFQTTREQAAWLAPYYQQRNQPVRSHGCAAAESAQCIPLQQMPNLTLEPNPNAISLEDLVADVTDGILVQNGFIMQSDSQGRTGILLGQMREIKKGRLANSLIGGVVFFNSQELWKIVKALGGVSTQGELHFSPNTPDTNPSVFNEQILQTLCKGQPAQLTSHSIRSVAATIPNQPLINLARKA